MHSLKKRLLSMDDDEKLQVMTIIIPVDHYNVRALEIFIHGQEFYIGEFKKNHVNDLFWA
jgi:hypothetical protein